MVHEAIGSCQFDACLPFFGAHVIADAFEIGVIFHRHLLRQGSFVVSVVRDCTFVQANRKSMTAAKSLPVISGMHLAVLSVKRIAALPSPGGEYYSWQIQLRFASFFALVRKGKRRPTVYPAQGRAVHFA